MDLHNDSSEDEQDQEQEQEATGKASESSKTSEEANTACDLVPNLKEYLVAHPEQVIGVVDSSDLSTTGRNNSDSVVSDPQRDFTFDLSEQIYGRHVIFVDTLAPERVASMNPNYLPE